MRAQLYMAAIPLLAVVAFAQDPVPQAATPPKPETKAAAAGTQDRQALPEMKTQNYSGTLADATCGAAGAATPAAASPAASDPAAASGAAEKPKTATTSGQGQACSVSASTSQFALKLKDGQVVKFDDVGNQRALEALKSKKKWTDGAAAQKPIHASASGVLNGDRLTVVSIN